MTFKIIGAIHFEAFKLWIKGIKFIKKKLNIKNNIKFNYEKSTFKNKKKLLSSTSTMPYQLYSKEKFNIIVPKNIIPLNPKIFDKLIFKSN